MTQARTVLLAGCGDVGARLAGELQADGWRVLALSRHRRPLPAGVEHVARDLSRDPGPLPAVGAVIYLASADARNEAAYQRCYVSGQQHLLRALPMPPRAWLFVSSTAVYADPAEPGAWLDERSPADAAHFRGRVLREAELVAHGAAARHVVLRPAGICGPGRDALRRRALDDAALAGAGDRWTNRVHRDDVAGMLALLLGRAMRDEPLEPVYIGVDAQPARYSEVVNFLRRKAGLPAWPFPAQAKVPGRRFSGAALRALGYPLRYPDYTTSLEPDGH